MLDAVRAEAAGGRVVLFPERDEHVEWALDHWDDANAVADMPLPADREAVVRLRRKDVLPLVAAEAGVPSPGTVLADGDDAVRDAGLRAPMVVKAVEGQEFALTFGQKALVAESVDEALAVARAGERARLPDDRPGDRPRLARADLLAARLRRARRPPAGDARRAKGAAGPAPLRDERGLRGRLRADGARPGPAAPAGRRLHGHRPRRVRAGPAGRRVPRARGQHAPARSGPRWPRTGTSISRGSSTTTCPAGRCLRCRRSRTT